MIKIRKLSKTLELTTMVGIDPESEGIAMARAAGLAVTHKGIEGARALPEWTDVQIVFDATSASTHGMHDEVCRSAGKAIIDLTPAAIGPYCVPVVNLMEHLLEPNVNMVSCGGQATIPMVYAVNRVSESLPYAEIVASVSSRSAGPGTRNNIDEFTRTTARGIETVGGATRGKAIIVLNPAEPPMIMRDTIYTLSLGAGKSDIVDSVNEMVEQVQSYVPGYRIKQELQFEVFGLNRKLNIPGFGESLGLKTSIFLEVEGAGHYLPRYAGNLDIMTSAAMTTAERMAEMRLGVAA